MIADGRADEDAAPRERAVEPDEADEPLEVYEAEGADEADGCVGPVRTGDAYEDDDRT